MGRLDLEQMPRSSSMDTSGILLMDSSFDAVVKESIQSQSSRSYHPAKKLDNPAHLNEHISVANVLDSINMSHLRSIFEREEVKSRL